MRISMILASALVSLGLFGVFASGCGPTVESACNNLDASLCSVAQKCQPFYANLAFGDAQTCESRLKDKCLGTLDAAGSLATADDIESCANAYSELSCSDLAAGVQPKSCDVRGEKADGESCATGAQCKSGHCQSNGEGQCGACVTPVSEGGSCAAANKPCVSGTYCDGDDKCAAFGVKGAACGGGVFCLSTLWCNAGKCDDKLATEGAACTDISQCDVNAGFVCSPLTMKCITIGVAKVGAACGVDVKAGTYTACELDTYCDADQTGAGTCKAKIAVGNSCTIDPDKGASDCVTGAQCIAGKCSTEFPVCN